MISKVYHSYHVEHYLPAQNAKAKSEDPDQTASEEAV